MGKKSKKTNHQDSVFFELVRQYRLKLILSALELYGGNRTQAARALGLERTTMLRMMRRLEIVDPHPKDKPMTEVA
jgi:DNA-binding NtrC family response regulator